MIPCRLAELDDFVGFASMQFQKRMARIEQSKGASLDHVYEVTQSAIDRDDA